jgi:hypothetical protein
MEAAHTRSLLMNQEQKKVTKDASRLLTAILEVVVMLNVPEDGTMHQPLHRHRPFKHHLNRTHLDLQLALRLQWHNITMRLCSTRTLMAIKHWLHSINWRAP